jgi:hypothetical protein
LDGLCSVARAWLLVAAVSALVLAAVACGAPGPNAASSPTTGRPSPSPSVSVHSQIGMLQQALAAIAYLDRPYQPRGNVRNGTLIFAHLIALESHLLALESGGVRAKVELLQQALASFAYGNCPHEPRGDVRKGTLIFAHLIALESDSVRFDCVQLYWDSAAFAAGRRFHLPVDINSGAILVRNQFHHVQRLPLAAGCVIVTSGPPVALTLAQCAEDYRRNPDAYTGPAGFWMTVDDSGAVSTMLQVWVQ